jgi:replication factor C small subunit
MSVELWVEQYRPKTLDEYVWQNSEQRMKVEEWLAAGALPHLLFSGSPGTGKTSLADLLLQMLKIPKGDIIKINASRERHVDTIQQRIVSFVSTWALGPSGIKYIILDEVDRMSPMAQDLLRGEIEIYSDVCRFIMTCNQPQKLTAALHSRLQQFTFQTLDRDEFTARIGEILHRESVGFDVEILLELVERTYPDLRKAINTAQQSVRDGRLHPPPETTEYSLDYVIEAAALFRAGRHVDGRKKIVENAMVEDFPDIYRFLYRNLDLWGDTEQQKDDALLAIRKGIVYHTSVADPEINLAACLVELTHIARG